MNFLQALPSFYVLEMRYSALFKKPKLVLTQLQLSIPQQFAVATIVLSYNWRGSSISMFPDNQILERERNIGLDF
jgi:hypothetical protein